MDNARNTNSPAISSRVKVTKISLNSKGDYIAVIADDPKCFARFAAGFKQVADMAERAKENIAAIEEKYRDRQGFEADVEKVLEMSKESVRFSEEAERAVDFIFGEGTLRKYFSDIYEEIPDFTPDADSILDFFDQIMPIMEGIFKRKTGTRKAQMEIYSPQDHKTPLKDNGGYRNGNGHKGSGR